MSRPTSQSSTRSRSKFQVKSSKWKGAGASLPIDPGAPHEILKNVVEVEGGESATVRIRTKTRGAAWRCDVGRKRLPRGAVSEFTRSKSRMPIASIVLLRLHAGLRRRLVTTAWFCDHFPAVRGKNARFPYLAGQKRRPGRTCQKMPAAAPKRTARRANYPTQNFLRF